MLFVRIAPSTFALSSVLNNLQRLGYEDTPAVKQVWLHGTACTGSVGKALAAVDDAGPDCKVWSLLALACLAGSRGRCSYDRCEAGTWQCWGQDALGRQHGRPVVRC